MIDIGDTAPDFILKNQSGEKVSLAKLLQNGDLILYFYPADSTPGCTAEACSFRDNYDDLSEINVQLVGISPQGPESHTTFSEKHSLPFPLLCDEDKKVIRAYGVDGPLGFGVRRVTYLIDQSKNVQNRVVADFFIGNHTKLIKSILQGKN